MQQQALRHKDADLRRYVSTQMHRGTSSWMLGEVVPYMFEHRIAHWATCHCHYHRFVPILFLRGFDLNQHYPWEHPEISWKHRLSLEVFITRKHRLCIVVTSDGWRTDFTPTGGAHIATRIKGSPVAGCPLEGLLYIILLWRGFMWPHVDMASFLGKVMDYADGGDVHMKIKSREAPMREVIESKHYLAKCGDDPESYGMGLACRNMFQPASCCIGLPGTAAWRGSAGLDSAWERKMGFDRFGISGTGEIWCIWPFIFVPWKLLKAFQGCKQHWARGLENDSPRSASVPPSSCELNLPQGADLGMVRADLLRAEACAWPQGAWSVGILFLKQNTLNQCASAFT